PIVTYIAAVRFIVIIPIVTIRNPNCINYATGSQVDHYHTSRATCNIGSMVRYIKLDISRSILFNTYEINYFVSLRIYNRYAGIFANYVSEYYRIDISVSRIVGEIPNWLTCIKWNIICHR